MVKAVEEIMFPELLWDDVYVTTEEFMAACGINSKSEISRYVRMGVLNPSKSGKKYMFCGFDQSSLQKYKESNQKLLSHKHSLEHKLDNLTKLVESILSTLQKFETLQPKTETPQTSPKPTQQPQPTKPPTATETNTQTGLTILNPDEPILYTVYGQTQEQDEANWNTQHVQPTYSASNLKRLYYRNGVQVVQLNDITNSLEAFSCRSLGMHFDGIYCYLENAKREPDEPMFDEYYSIPPLHKSAEAAGQLTEREAIYSYNQVTKAANKYQRTLTNFGNTKVTLGYPDFETCLVAFYHDLNARILKAKLDNPGATPNADVIPGYLKRNKVSNFLELAPLYNDYLELKFEPKYFKNKTADSKVYHGDNKPLAVDPNGHQLYPDTWEAGRYAATNGRYEFPEEDDLKLKDLMKRMLGMNNSLNSEDDTTYNTLKAEYDDLVLKRMHFVEYYNIDRKEV